MRLDDFEDALDSHGGDLSRWPESLRHSAESLLEVNQQAQSLLKAAQTLDAALAADPEETADPGLTDRIMQRIAQHEVGIENARAEKAARRTSWQWLQRLAPPVPRELVAITCGTIVGILVGTALMDIWPRPDSGIDLFNLTAASYFLG